jgi:hypothetical protein
MARSAKPKQSAKKVTAMRPVLLAAGLGLYWFAVYQDGGAEANAPIWGYMVMVGLRLVADVVGAWIVIAALQLVFACAKVGLTYARSRWMMEG